MLFVGLFGPTGTGETLMARQIAKRLNGKEPKVYCLTFLTHEGNCDVIILDEINAICNIRDFFEDAINFDNHKVHLLVGDMS